MPLRAFIDRSGVHWEVWEAHPTLVERRTPTDRRSVVRDEEPRRLDDSPPINADSGVFIRKPQLQIRDYPVAGPDKYKSLKNYRPQDWNEIVVTVKNGVARCLCNGEVLEDALKLPENGSIGLEADRGEMCYRNIRLKEE